MVRIWTADASTLLHVVEGLNIIPISYLGIENAKEQKK